MPHLFRDLMPPGREDEGWAAFGFLTEDPADLPPELDHPRPVGTSLRSHHGHRPHLPQLRRLPRRQRPHRRRRRAADRRRHALEHRRPLGLPGLPRRAPPSTSASAPTASSPRSTPMGLELDLVNRLALQASSASAWSASGCSTIVDRFDDFVHARADLRPRPLRHLQPGQGAAELELRRRSPSASASASSTSRRSSCRARRPACSCTGTATTPRSPSATAPPPSAPAPPRRSSTATSLKRMEDWLATAEPPRFADVFPGQFDAALAARGRAGLRPRVRRLPRRLGPRLHRRLRRQGHADRRDRHRPRPARQLHPRPRGQPERALRRLRRRALPDLPQDRRLRQRPARRPLAARALPAQRLGPDARGAARRRPTERPRAFLRGYDVYDPRAMGFVSDPAAHRPGALRRASSATSPPPPPPPTARPARRR